MIDFTKEKSLMEAMTYLYLSDDVEVGLCDDAFF